MMKKKFRPVAMFLMMIVFLCSFQCTDIVEYMFPDGTVPEIKLLKEMEAPVWPVYSASENLPPTNIFFVVRNLSGDAEVWAECLEGDLEVSVAPVCTRYTLSVSATDEFSGSSTVKIMARDKDGYDELPVLIELARIVPDSDEITVSGEASAYSVMVDANKDFSARTYDDWLVVEAGKDDVFIRVGENTTDSLREATVMLYDIYEVVTAEIAIRQKPAI